MKPLAAGALVLSLLAGSVALAGQGFRGAGALDDGDRGHHDRRGDSRASDGRHDSRHGDWRGGREDGNRGGDRHGRQDWNRGNDSWRYGYRDNYRYSPPPPPPPRYSYRYSKPYYWDRPRYSYGYYYRPHGYYPHYWRRGEQLPVAYYAPRYIVTDYYGCGLRRPPYGYHWVRVDGDVVLAAIATGVIVDIVYHAFH